MERTWLREIIQLWCRQGSWGLFTGDLRGRNDVFLPEHQTLELHLEAKRIREDVQLGLCTGWAFDLDGRGHITPLIRVLASDKSEIPFLPGPS
jgi:hypothetical protein